MVQRTGLQANDTVWTIIDTSKPTSTTHPVNCWLNNQNIDHHASVNWYVQPSTDTWPHSYTYDLPRASRLIPDSKSSKLMVTKNYKQPSQHFQQSMNFLPKDGLYTTAWTLHKFFMYQSLNKNLSFLPHHLVFYHPCLICKINIFISPTTTPWWPPSKACGTDWIKLGR